MDELHKENLDETTYLMSSAKNREILLESISKFENGEGLIVDLPL